MFSRVRAFGSRASILSLHDAATQQSGSTRHRRAPNFAPLRACAGHVVRRKNETEGKQWIGIHVIIRKLISATQRRSAGIQTPRSRATISPANAPQREATRCNPRNGKKRASDNTPTPVLAYRKLHTRQFIARTPWTILHRGGFGIHNDLLSGGIPL